MATTMSHKEGQRWRVQHLLDVSATLSGGTDWSHKTFHAAGRCAVLRVLPACCLIWPPAWRSHNQLPRVASRAWDAEWERWKAVWPDDVMWWKSSREV